MIDSPHADREVWRPLALNIMSEDVSILVFSFEHHAFLNLVRGFVHGLVSLPTLQAGSNMYFFSQLSMNMYHRFVIYLL